VILLRCSTVNIILSVCLYNCPCLRSSFARLISCDQAVVLEEETQTLVTLPKWNIIKAPRFKTSKGPIWPFVIPLCASSIPIALLDPPNQSSFTGFGETYCLTLAALRLTVGTTCAAEHPFPMTAIRLPV
jgi:hypothetical protein